MLLDSWPLQCSILYDISHSRPTGASYRRPAHLTEIVLQTKTILLDLDLLVCHMSCQVRKGLLELDVVLSNVLRGTLLQTVPGVSEFLVQILESMIRLKRLTKKLARVRGLVSPMSRLIRLIHSGPQGPRATLQIGRCQLDIIRVGSSAKIIFDHRRPLPHMPVVLLVPVLGRRRRPETINVSRGLGSSRCCLHLACQLADRRLQPDVDHHHCSELHILQWTTANGFLLQSSTSLIRNTSVPLGIKLSSSGIR
jgi:hypothetical protein